MIGEEIVEEPDVMELASVQKSKTKGADPVIKKKTQMNWGLLALGAAGVISYLWDKRKKEKALALVRERQLARTQQLNKVNTQKEPSGNGNSPDARLWAMGINTGQPGAYQGNEIFKEIQ